VRAASGPIEISAVEEIARLRRDLLERARAWRISPAERALALVDVCRRWREPDDPGRRALLASLIHEGGYAPSTAEAGLDASLRRWGPGAWRSLAARLPDSEGRGGDAREGVEVGVVPHVLGSALPGPNLLPILFTLLAGGAPLVRVGRHVPTLPAAALASLARVEPRLASRAAVCRWPRERAELTRALFAGARVGSATGSDGATTAVASLIETGTRLLAHPHRVSFAYLGAAATASPEGRRLAARRLAVDVSLHDQQGCLSPVGVLMEGRAAAAPLELAESLAEALAERERLWPSGERDVAGALAVRSFHDEIALRAARGGGTRVFSGERLSWVVAAIGGGGVPSRAPLHRCVWVRGVRGPSEALGLLGRWRGATAALGVAGDAPLRNRARALARALGATRVVPLGRMQSPTLAWRQDDLHPLLDLLADDAAPATRGPTPIATPLAEARLRIR
jgi:hypothetical protein